ncbi:MAG: M50 family metallopeptidase [Elusimicrobia bacterium]|nr:M50 family metallopeptidase [Elusimicrobiota bacterium]
MTAFCRSIGCALLLSGLWGPGTHAALASATASASTPSTIVTFVKPVSIGGPAADGAATATPFQALRTPDRGVELEPAPATEPAPLLGPPGEATAEAPTEAGDQLRFADTLLSRPDAEEPEETAGVKGNAPFDGVRSANTSAPPSGDGGTGVEHGAELAPAERAHRSSNDLVAPPSPRRSVARLGYAAATLIGLALSWATLAAAWTLHPSAGAALAERSLNMAFVPLVLGLWSSFVVHEYGHFLWARLAGAPARPPRWHLTRQELRLAETVQRPRFLPARELGEPSEREPIPVPVSGDLRPQDARQSFYARLGGPASNVIIGGASLAAGSIAGLVDPANAPAYLGSASGLSYFQLAMGFGSALPGRADAGGSGILRAYREWKSQSAGAAGDSEALKQRPPPARSPETVDRPSVPD